MFLIFRTLNIGRHNLDLRNNIIVRHGWGSAGVFRYYTSVSLNSIRTTFYNTEEKGEGVVFVDTICTWLYTL